MNTVYYIANGSHPALAHRLVVALLCASKQVRIRLVAGGSIGSQAADFGYGKVDPVLRMKNDASYQLSVLLKGTYIRLYRSTAFTRVIFFMNYSDMRLFHEEFLQGPGPIVGRTGYPPGYGI
jgi:hypothetical protein